MRNSVNSLMDECWYNFVIYSNVKRSEALQGNFCEDFEVSFIYDFLNA